MLIFIGQTYDIIIAYLTKERVSFPLLQSINVYKGVLPMTKLLYGYYFMESNSIHSKVSNYCNIQTLILY